MAAVIRLSRKGKRNSPVYRVVVVDSSKPVKSGTYLDNLGLYNPNKKENPGLNGEKAKEWIKKGAKPTDRVLKILKQEKIIA